MAKLSEQLRERSATIRPTRTKRKIEEMQRKKQIAENQKKFEELKSKAEQVQQEKLSGVTSVEDYEEIYNDIDPELQPFFSTPTEVRQQRDQRIQENISKLQLKKEEAERRLQDVEDNYKQDIDNLRQDVKSNEEWQRRRKEIRDQYEEDRDYWRGYNEGLSQGLSKLKKGEDIALENVTSYADDLGDFKRKEQELQNKERRERQPVITTEPIDPEKFLSGLKQVSTREVKRVEGGKSEVTILEGEGRKVQVVRSRDTGDIRIVELEGKQKGTVIVGKGLSDAELQEQQIAELEKRRAEREPFVNIEDIETPKRSRIEKVNIAIRDTVGKVISKAGDIKLPLFFGISGAGGGTVPIRSVTKDASEIAVKGAGLVVEKTFVGELKVPLTTGVTGTKFVAVREFTQPLKEKISAKQEELILKQIENLGIKQEFSPIFEAEYQARFEDKYGERIIRGDITFGEAEKQFKKSYEAKLVAQRYGQVIEKKRAGIITKETYGLVGLSLVGLGVKLAPETYGELAVESLVLGAGVKASALIPSKVSTGITAGFGVVGASEFFDPRLSGERRVVGGGVAVISGAILGIKLVKYLKQPTIKQVKIEPPKIDLKTQTVIGKEGKIFSVKRAGNEIIVRQTKFPTQKIQQVGIAGRRTIVSTKIRDILRLEPIYRGVPTVQPLGYQKALELVRKSSVAQFTSIQGKTTTISLRGLSETQLKSILRYTPPKVIEVNLEKGFINTIDKSAFGRFEFRTAQPVITVDEALGIKTRGASPIKTIVDVQRKLYGKGTVVSGVEKKVLKASGIVTTKEVRLGQVFDLDLKEGVGVKRIKIENLDVFAEERFKFLYRDLIERSISRRFYPARARTLMFEEGQTQIIQPARAREVATIDLGRLTGESEQFIKPYPIQKTPLSKTFGADVGVEKVKEILRQKQITPPIQEAIGSAQLRTAIIPENLANLKNQIKSISDITSQIAKSSSASTSVASSLSVASLVAIRTGENQRSKLNLDLALRSNLRTNTILKNAIKSAQEVRSITKTATAPSLKSSQLLSSQIATSISVANIFSEPIIPKINIPTIPKIFPFELPVAKEVIKRRIRRNKEIEKFFLLPDFTSRALGLEPKELTEKQALKEIKRIQTGLEIRRAIKLIK